MYRIIRTLLILLVLGVGIYMFRQPIKDGIVRIQSTYAPCQHPISYTIGAFDPRFGLSDQAVRAALAEAEMIWEQSISRDLFVYATEGVLKVNFVYDYRQQATATLQTLGIEVNESRASYDVIKEKYEALQVTYAQAKAEYLVRIAAFEKKQDAYAAAVSSWNTKGGAPEKEYNRLNEEKVALQTELAAIERMQTKVNTYVDDINAMVVVLNRLALTLNISVAKYNEIGISRGEEFEEGLYQSDATGQKIDIYEFSNHDQLVRVLAHELGHALGLDHVSDQNAIMYKINQGKTKTATNADIDALRAHCKIE